MARFGSVSTARRDQGLPSCWTEPTLEGIITGPSHVCARAELLVQPREQQVVSLQPAGTSGAPCTATGRSVEGSVWEGLCAGGQSPHRVREEHEVKGEEETVCCGLHPHAVLTGMYRGDRKVGS